MFFGHIISSEGLRVDLQKVEAIESWERLKIVSKVQSFLGLVGYYRRSVEGFSKLAIPLTTLMKKALRLSGCMNARKVFKS